MEQAIKTFLPTDERKKKEFFESNKITVVCFIAACRAH